MLGRVKDYVQSGLLEYHYLRKFKHPSNKPQLYVYDYCLSNHKRGHHFIGFIDLDEFVVLKDPSIPDLPSLLSGYEGFGGLAMNWIMFGSSGHVARPQGSTLQNYWKCIPKDHPENHHVKSFVNTQYGLKVGPDPHHFIYSANQTAVTTALEPVDGAKSANVTIDKVALHHYATKSFEEYEAKIRRGSAMKNHKTTHFFQDIDSLATDSCKL